MPHTEGKVVGVGGGGPLLPFSTSFFLVFFLAMQVPFWNTSYKKGMNNLEKNPLSPAVTCLLVYNRIEHNIVE